MPNSDADVRERMCERRMPRLSSLARARVLEALLQWWAKRLERKLDQFAPDPRQLLLHPRRSLDSFINFADAKRTFCGAYFQ